MLSATCPASKVCTPMYKHTVFFRRGRGHVEVPSGVRRAPRAASAALRWLAQTATRGGRFAGPFAGGGRAVSVRRGRERALQQRRDGAARGRPG